MTWNPDNYPPPTVPLTPQLSLATLLGGSKQAAPFLLDTKADVQYLTSGRIALARGLKNIDIGEGDVVLVPAYHCPSLVDPIPWLGAVPIYYRLTEELKPDWDDVLSKMDKKVRALVVVHYFGFAQPEIEQMAKFCQAHDIHLIEDCAHAMFGHVGHRVLGSIGSFSIASPAKFFPVLDGGLLISNSRSIDDDHMLERAGLAFELKSIVSPIEKSVRYGHFFPFNHIFRVLMWLKDIIWKQVKKWRGISPKSSTLLSPGSADGGFAFDPKWINIRMSRGSKWLLKWSSKQRNFNNRRQLYNKWVKAFANSEHCSVLFPNLPETAAPYVFPLLVENDNFVFDRLMLQGVPIYRWDALYTDCCEISNRYSTQLFQFPCHQDLTDVELDWIIKRIKEALSLTSND